MRPLTLSLTTFLKITTKKTRGKIGEVRRFTGRGGYDFYKKLKALAGRLARHEIDLAEAEAIVATITRKPERDHTLVAIKKISSWLTKHDPKWIDPPSKLYQSDSEVLRIKLEPELAFENADGAIHCLHLWNLAKPEMKDQLAGEGLRLLRDELGTPTNAFGILDLRKTKVFEESAISASSGLQLKYDLMTIEEIWKDIHNPSLGPEETIAHITSLKLPPPPGM